MSGLAGVYSRNGSPIEDRVLDRLSAGLAHIGPDGEYRAAGENVAMIYRPLHTYSALDGMYQPYRGEDGHILCIAGRIDNAQLLCRAEENKNAPQNLHEAVLRLYKSYGVAGFREIVGEFALALWDPAQEQLVLACDALGRSPLYFHCSPQRVTWASQSRALANAGSVNAVADEEYVADFLVNRPATQGPLQGVQIVRGGTAMIVEQERVRTVRYWSPDPSRTVCYSRDEDYEEHFREVFFEAVNCRIPFQGTFFCELSGGVDSTSIACAADLIVQQRSSKVRLTNVSYVFPAASSSDESHYIAMVEAQLGKRSLHIYEEEYPILAEPPDSFLPDVPSNDISFLSRHDRLAEEMSQCGARVVLSGIGGDQMFWSTPPFGLPLADLLLRRRAGELGRELRRWSQSTGVPYYKTFLYGALLPAFRSLSLVESRSATRIGEWFDSAFVKRMDLESRMRGMPDDLGFKLPSSSAQYSLIRRTMRHFALERATTSVYIDARYPYLDRRLVEFAMAIPLEQKVRKLETRSIVRRALRGLIPEEIRLRTSKTGPSEAFYRAIIREGPYLARLCKDLRIAALGIVDAKRFEEALRRARHGLVQETSQLLSTISLELWLRSLDRRIEENDVVNRLPAKAANY